LAFAGEIEFLFGSGPGLFDDAMEKNDFLVQDDEKDPSDPISKGRSHFPKSTAQ